jgi:hypothetical protein
MKMLNYEKMKNEVERCQHKKQKPGQVRNFHVNWPDEQL